MQTNKNELNKPYVYAAIAFILAITKYFLVGNTLLTPKYFVFELISFGLFLAIVFIFDRFIRMSLKEKSLIQTRLEKTQEESKQEILRLQKTITSLRHEQNKDGNIEELSLVVQQLTNGLKDSSNDKSFTNRLLSNLSKVYELGLAVCYLYDKPSEQFTVKATYGFAPDIIPANFAVGEGLNGQAVADKEYRFLDDVPEDYFDIESASGQSKPSHIYLLPIVKDGNSIGLIEMASFARIDLKENWSQLSESIINTMNF